MGLKKLCRCGNQIDITAKCCAKCKPKYDAERAQYNKRYDKSKRKHADFYNTDEWKELRVVVLTKANGLDLYDYFINNKITTANTAHHIVEIREDYSKRLDITNLIPLSSTNHSKIHKMYFRNKVATQQMLIEILAKAKASGIG